MPILSTTSAAEVRAAELRGDNLATLLANARDERGVTNAQLGAAAGIDESTVGGILQGDAGINCPPLRRLRGFARVLGLTMGAVMEAAERDGCEYAEQRKAEFYLTGRT